MNEIIRNSDLPPIQLPSRTVYQFADLEVGDAILVDADKAASAKSAAYQWVKKTGSSAKFTVAPYEGGGAIVRRVA